MSEVKPKFAPKVQEVWNDCETYVDSINPEAAAAEIEFFVNELLFDITNSMDDFYKFRAFLIRKGYINE